MKVKPLHKVSTMAGLKEWLDSANEIKLYGAGYYSNFFLQEIKKSGWDYRDKISCIMVGDIQGIPVGGMLDNFRVIIWQEAKLKAEDCVFLTLGSRYTDEVYSLLKTTGADIIQIDFNIFQETAYHEVKESLKPFIDRFPEGISQMNEPDFMNEVTAWTCWWQGVEQAPELVKACWESQKRNLPVPVKQVIITKDNYEKYISMPDYIMEKVNSGIITLTTFSDILRAALLYKYGGFWMDSTLFVLKPLDKDILNYPVYTRNLPETQYCTKAMWADWFMYAKPDNILFQFLMEAFFYYYSVYNETKYYFLVDYIIAAACNTFPGVEKQLREVPFNNEKAMDCCRYLTDIFSEQIFCNCTEDTYVQKLTYKLDWRGKSQENTLYQRICRNEIVMGRDEK